MFSFATTYINPNSIHQLHLMELPTYRGGLRFGHERKAQEAILMSPYNFYTSIPFSSGIAIDFKKSTEEEFEAGTYELSSKA